MVEVEMHWVGMLCNVDSSILSLKLPYEFEIKYFTRDEAISHFIDLNKISNRFDFYMQYVYPQGNSCFNQEEKRLYYIYRKDMLDIDIEIYDGGPTVPLSYGESERLFNEHIRKLIRLMRLLREGDIRVPEDYTYYEFKGSLESYITRSTLLHVSQNMFHFAEDDLEELDRLNRIEFPFKQTFLNLAFDNYEDSYETQHPILSFLSLMIAMEALFNPGRSELRYRISRNCAVLLGYTREGSLDIFANVRDAYDVRSKVLHTGEQTGFKEDLIPLLRHYVRESIKKMLAMDEPKDVILNKLNTLGFGEIRKYG